jgi:hypothetical protein
MTSTGSYFLFNRVVRAIIDSCVGTGWLSKFVNFEQCAFSCYSYIQVVYVSILFQCGVEYENVTPTPHFSCYSKSLPRHAHHNTLIYIRSSPTDQYSSHLAWMLTPYPGMLKLLHGITYIAFPAITF